MRPANILHLGVKELRGLLRDPVMLFLIVYAFSLAIYTAATAMPETLHKAPIAIVDEDRSQLSQRISRRLLPASLHAALPDQPARDGCAHGRRPRYLCPDHPGPFQRNLLAGRTPASSSTWTPPA